MTSASHQRDAKPLILVADDSRVVRVSLKNILQQDYRIIEAQDGAQAWDILNREHGIRLMFSDLSMPNLDGLGLLAKLRQAEDERIRTIPFIVVTGKDEDEQIRNQLLQQGANDLITKPFVAQEITERAKRHIKIPQQPGGSNEPEDEFLTGITNKARFTQIVRKGLSYAIRNKNELALLLLKLDQFDTIKKHYSEPAIEHILITTAEIIRTRTHLDDKIAYFGEGTFAILLPASNAVSARYLGKRILSDLLAKKFYLGDSDATVTASIGVSAPDIKPATTFSELLHLAEQRLQAAINAGGQRVVDKGNARITPVNTLLTDSEDADNERQRLLKQTEKEMRELALQEVEKIRASRQYDNDIDSNLTNAQEIHDALLLAEQENKLIKQELARLRVQTQDTEQLRKQLHETDARLQQFQLKYKQLHSDYETLRSQAEESESRQNEWQEADFDNSIVEQHLLQENNQLQKELNTAKHHIEESKSTIRKSEQIIANLKHRMKAQKAEFDTVLSEAQHRYTLAEQRITQLEAVRDKDRLSLTPLPSVHPVKPVQAPTAVTPGAVPTAQSPQPRPHKSKSNKAETISDSKGTAPPRRRLRKLTIIAITFTLGLAGYLIWQYSTDTDAARSTATSSVINEQGSDNDPHDLKGKDPSMAGYLREEARLQKELALREAAEEEFQMLRGQ